MVRVFVTPDGEANDFDLEAMERKRSKSSRAPSTGPSPRSPLPADAPGGGFAKMAQKVRTGVGSVVGNGAGAHSSRSAGSARFSGAGVIDEDDIILEGASSSRSARRSAPEAPTLSIPIVSGVAKGITKRGASLVRKIVDKTHLSDLKDSLRARTMPTWRTASSSREGLMRSDSDASAGRAFPTAGGARGGSGLSRRDSGPWVCFGFESDFDGSGGSHRGEEDEDDEEEYEEYDEERDGAHAGQPLSDAHEYENLIEALQREVSASRERMAGMADELARLTDEKAASERRRAAEADGARRSARAEHSRLHAENLRLRTELQVLQREGREREERRGAGPEAAEELGRLRERLPALEAELERMMALAKKSTERADHLELQMGIYRNVARSQIDRGGAAALGRLGMPEETPFLEKDVGNLIAAAVQDVHRYLLQLRGNGSTKAKQRSALRQFQSRYHPDKNPVITNLFEELFKVITQEARMMGMDI